ncbi:nucleotidyltransferase domain-containing protein [Aliterella atlantica]|uniref:DNA polymerase subunit beta n=1 Tax=Aliterella atlantica CENA595 TaxID=1618023 RepID=A0A0D8ZSQ3_9CYAN|nr:DUF4037 domain-containing protein [Aliterella atlantica]KJH71392.1 DNA polymerase subunit beta [Aliterella atlantica CENA595]
MTSATNLSTAKKIATKFSNLPQVIAVTLAGSQVANVFDSFSDLDIYVYTRAEIPTDFRANIAREFATRIEIDNQFWEPGDEFVDINSGRGIDIMYRSPDWIESQLENVLVEYQASVGYSTCFWWNIVHSNLLYSRDGWFEKLQRTANQPYPELLRRAIVAKNYPILRKNISSYFHQIEVAISRNDIIAINHRIAALMASYFDIIFAANYVLHPGEKRLIQYAKSLCSKLPVGMEENINEVISASYLSENQSLLAKINILMDALDRLLSNEKLLV